MDVSLLVTLAVIHCVALVSPGPDFAIMVKIATSQSRNTAIATAAGISVAILAHTILSLTGVSLVIKSSHTLYLLVQLLGASYLAWMGFGALKAVVAFFSKPKTALNGEGGYSSGFATTSEHSIDMPMAGTVNVLTPKQSFMRGLYTNLLNPKALVFFITLFSALITPSVTPVTKFAAALMLFVLSLLWFGFLALMLSKVKVQQKLQRLTPIIDGIIGVIFMSVAVAIVSSLLLA
ncbi:LysE family transporter [Shewanella xiamenensis]|uniref:LysE family transporter n=1 Tax=Shewanella xiamenensis TaxID=332186 RepID=UPI001664B3D2|nr:LysE family transporter [Shewanella xiamenensis]MCL1069557.1 LysE family transporter [Shewanella xiamenensis]GGM84214.1 lysine transporter LysE [Shewanella xiamenensis]